MPIKKELKINLLLLCVSLFIVLVFGEIFLRATGYYGVRGESVTNLRLVEDDVLDYRYEPNSSWIKNNLRYNINKHGWRDYNHDYEKPDNTVRILVLGDSITNGYGINMEEIYAKQFEQELNKDSGSSNRYEVITIAMSGLNTKQEAYLFETEGIKFDPDVVVIGYALNDPEKGSSLRKSRQSKEKRSLLYKLKQAANRLSIVHLLYRSSQKLRWKISIALGIEETADYVKEDYFSALHNDPKKWGSVVEGFAKIRSLAKEHNIASVLMIFPVMSDLGNYKWTDVHKQVSDAASKSNFIVLDLVKDYSKYKGSDLQVDSGDHVHPNAIGHKIAADALYQFFKKNDHLLTHSADKTV
ncbi:MAG: hypothetical protein AMK71_08065 [Nitrospira bacterium SG8_35_4]|nr:MAG: hypothetical protein AMK71_08065 [Nitrospira bacterium SG8_35_4]